MADPQARLDELIARLREHDHRLTPQRMAVLKILTESDEHPSVEQIYERVKTDFPMTSLATVYKTLNVLKELGEVIEIKVDGRSHYEDNVTPHPHLICMRCNGITDLPPEAMAKMPEKALAETGFQTLEYHLEIRGLCSRCQEQEEQEAQK